MSQLSLTRRAEADTYHIKPLPAGFAPFFGILPPLGANSQVTYYGNVQNIAPGVCPAHLQPLLHDQR